MTTKPKARKFRIRPSPAIAGARAAAIEPGQTGSTPGDAPQAAGPAPDTGAGPHLSQEIAAIRAEGLTARQLRMARRVAQKQGLSVTSDYDAIRQLRAAGIDPFQRSKILDLVSPEAPSGAAERSGAEARVQLPQTVPDSGNALPSTQTGGMDNRAVEIRQIQRDIVRRRRWRLALLFVRLAVFVFVPTAMVGYYYYAMATPMYATKSEFVIQQSEAASAAGGLGGLFQGTSMATQQDAITVQSYLASRAAMVRLDRDRGFKAHFSGPEIDVIQRLDTDASNEAAYKVFQDKVKISYDPTEGILRMEVVAAAPEISQQFSEALIRYAEEQVDQLSQRPRDAAMAGARQTYEEAEARRAAALAAWLRIQEEVQQIDPVGETAARTQQISALETERQQLELTLQERLNVPRPNQPQVNALRSQIANIDALIADLREAMTNAEVGETSLASRNTELRLAEENYTFQTMQVQAALSQMETARIEASRQVRFLSLGVEPIAPDEATYPRAFENTLLALLIFSGIYLMISITASILREQVTT